MWHHKPCTPLPSGSACRTPRRCRLCRPRQNARQVAQFVAVDTVLRKPRQSRGSRAGGIWVMRAFLRFISSDFVSGCSLPYICLGAVVLEDIRGFVQILRVASWDKREPVPTRQASVLS